MSVEAAATEPAVSSGLWLPLFGELAEPRAVMELAAEAEVAGWHGVFVWDQLGWREPVTHLGDPWTTLAAIATATERVRLGPMVCPLPRRRPAKVARESAALDRLSAGRLTLGVGIGSDRFGGELSRTGEEPDDRLRGEMLDEALTLLMAAWSGEPVHHDGKHYTVDGMQFLPRPAQRPRVPVWVAGLSRNAKPLRRAARFDGFFPANLEHPDQLAGIAAALADLRPPGRPYDLVVAPPVGVDPLPYVDAGATWWLPEFTPEDVTLDVVRGVLRDGPLPT